MKMTTLCSWFAAAILAGVLGSPCGADEESGVEVPDASLRAIILELKNKYEQKGDDITREDLQNIYFLDASGQGIRDLTGLEHCVNLGEARLADNAIVDISPLAGCQNLQSLDLSRNQITDLSPLSDVGKLQYLNVEHNAIETLEGVSALKSLNSLYAAHNQIDSAEPVGQLQRLWSLDLSHNRIRDISPVASLPRLTSLSLAFNEIAVVAPITSSNGYYLTDLRGNQINDISPLVEWARQDSTGEQRFAPFWRLYLKGNPLTGTEQADLQELRELGVRVDININHAAQSPDSRASEAAKPGDASPHQAGATPADE